MKNLPKDMIPDRDNQVYFDTELGMFYIIKREDRSTHDYIYRHYILFDFYGNKARLMV